MTNPSVSVIVVSRGRPNYLRNCLLAISQLQYEKFEIVIVADQRGLDAVRGAQFSGLIKLALCEVANISIERNIGLALAAGEVVAFLDDDSVPEPGWLYHLGGTFADATVDAAGGYVRGRNGISYQYQAQTLDSRGFSAPVEISDTAPISRAGTADICLKTEGTNCAFRRRTLESIGGFDSAFAYLLDDSDVSMRIGKLGGKTAIVPLAQIHHRSSASDYRNADRLPLSLEQIGKSTAIYLRKHCPTKDHDLVLNQTLEIHRKRLVRLMF